LRNFRILIEKISSILRKLITYFLNTLWVKKKKKSWEIRKCFELKKIKIHITFVKCSKVVFRGKYIVFPYWKERQNQLSSFLP
jgi:hypothetical protein